MFPHITTTDTTPSVSPQIVSTSEVVRWSAETGNPHADQALAVTVPAITVDLTATNWHTGGGEFWWNTGTIAIRMRQQIFISSGISACARGIWTGHENLHVADNRTILNSLAAEAARDSSLQDIFSGRHFERDNFSLIQQTVINVISDIFRRLTGRQVSLRDTRAEYSRVNQTILRSCPGPHYHTVARGENLSMLSDFYYGNQSHATQIYEQNRGIIGSNPNLILPGQRLELPRI